jgi:predicted RNase H-like HicB family nuclease
MESYLIVIQDAGNNFGAYSPDVLGCVATGQTIAETTDNMKTALAFHFEAMAEEGQEQPIPKGLAYYSMQREPFFEPGDYLTEISISWPQLQTA